MPDKKLAVIGFCMGGGLTWRLLAAGEPQLAAAVPFYGPAPDNPDFAGSKHVAVLGFYGALDARVNATEAVAQQALDKAGMVNELVIEPGADHAFFNDTGAALQRHGRRRRLAPCPGLAHQVRGLSPARATVFVRNFPACRGTNTVARGNS